MTPYTKRTDKYLNIIVVTEPELFVSVCAEPRCGFVAEVLEIEGALLHAHTVELQPLSLTPKHNEIVIFTS